MFNISDFVNRKCQQQPITMLTCYDFTFARILDSTDIDVILVGDSAAMVMHGYDSTISATIEMMEFHTRAVAKGAPNKWIVADMPFLSYRKGTEHAMSCVQRLMQAGAHMIKPEGCLGNEALIEHCVTSGVPVMGHLGLTPQMMHQLGGFRVQGKQPESAKILLEQGKILENIGCSALVLECVPSELAAMMSRQLKIPVIGIGAGPDVDGQVLVLQDLLGLNTAFKPKFLKTYCDGFSLIKTAMDQYVSEVKEKQFPEAIHSYR